MDLTLQYLLPMLLLLIWGGRRLLYLLKHDLDRRLRTDYKPRATWKDLLIVCAAFVPGLNWLVLAMLTWFVIVDGLEALWDWVKGPLFPMSDQCPRPDLATYCTAINDAHRSARD